MNLFFRGFPKINTERLTLRQVEEKDLQDLYQLFNSIDTKKFQNPHYYSNEELNNLYLDGYEINLEYISKNKIIGCHQECEFIFNNAKNN